MPLNPSIPGAVMGLPQLEDPFATMQGLMNMREQREQIRKRKLDADAAQVKADDDAALRTIIQKRIRSTGVPDWDGIIEDLHTTGHPNKAIEVTDWVRKSRKDEADALKASLENTRNSLQLGTGFVQAILTESAKVEDPAAKQAVFDRYKPFIVGTVGKDLGSQLGDKFDQARLEGVTSWGQNAQEQLSAQRLALDRITEARLGAKSKEELYDAFHQSAGEIFSIARNPDDWAKALKTMDSQGMPEAIRAQIPEQFSPENAAFMQNWAVNSKDRLTLAGAAETRKETKRHNLVEESLANRRLANEEGDTIDLTPEAMEAAARRFAVTGQTGITGYGKRANAQKVQIMNLAGDKYPKLDIATNAAEYHANRTSLVGLTKQSDQLKTYEDTALKNLRTFLDSAKGVEETGSPFLNKPIRAFAENVLGDPKMSAYNTARRVVLPEFARILNQFGQSGVLSNQARAETEEALKEGATMKQIVSAARVLVQDATNRRTATDDQISAITKRITTEPTGRTTPPAVPAPGATVAITNGTKTYNVPADQVDAALQHYPGFRRK